MDNETYIKQINHNDIEDLEQVIKIEQLIHKFDNWGWSKKKFLDHLNQKNCFCLVIEHKNKIVGFLIYVYDHFFKSILLLNLAIHPIYQNLGFEIELIKKIKEKLRRGKIEIIKVIVLKKNLTAKLFFERQGFLTSRDKINYKDYNEEAYFMKYRISDLEFEEIIKKIFES